MTGDDELNEKLEARRRYGLVIFASLYTFFVFGAFFGWGPMQLMLEENGNFASLCTPKEQEDDVGDFLTSLSVTYGSFDKLERLFGATELL